LIKIRLFSRAIGGVSLDRDRRGIILYPIPPLLFIPHTPIVLYALACPIYAKGVVLVDCPPYVSFLVIPEVVLASGSEIYLKVVVSQ
jgi:hypothetical protein